MEIDLQDNKSVDSFKGEMDLVKEDDDEIVVPQKERLAKMLEKIKNRCRCLLGVYFFTFTFFLTVSLLYVAW